MSVGTLLLIILIIVLIGGIAQVAAQQGLGLLPFGWPRTGAAHPAHSCVDGSVVATCLLFTMPFALACPSRRPRIRVHSQLHAFREAA
jgi:hypothetical protein